MTFENPIWLVLLLPLGVAYSTWRPESRILRVLWILSTVLVVLGMCGPDLALPSRRGSVIVVADRSQSMPSEGLTMQRQWIDLLRKSMSPGDRLGVVSFGRRGAVECLPQRAEFAGFGHDVDRSQSNLAEGLRTALSLVSAEDSARLLVFSDGQWTGDDPLGVAAALAGRGIPVDYRLQERPVARDLSIERFRGPRSAAPGEAFLLSAWLRAPAEQSVGYELRRNGALLARGTHRVSAGLNRLAFRDRAERPGTLRYDLRIQIGPQDPIPENNRARLLCGVRGPRPILQITPGAESGLADLLRAGKLDIVRQTGGRYDLDLAALSSYAAVILENVPAGALGPAGLELVAAWVRHGGGGLMMTGGRNTYGPGGYFKSALDPVLPVSMELRREHRKLRLAIVVALDRSGSMSMSAGAGRTKMDLANLGTVQVLDLLGDTDELGVIAVDSSPHTIVDMDQVSRVRGHRERILSIGSRGGGIFVYEALVAASKMLLQATAGTRHIILFADAADAEEPGQYADLLAKCRQANITVSVVGLGTNADPDAALLEDIAQRGEGRCFFTTDPQQIPRLFAQDTFAVARSTFIEEETPVQWTAGLLSVTGARFPDPPPVGGYNLCYLKPEATPGGLTEDEYKAPLVASWQAGNGRVLCFTGEADGDDAGPFAGWDRVGDFYTGLARWTAGEAGDLPGGAVLTQRLNGGTCTVRLHLDPERESDPFNGRPEVSFLRGTPGSKPTVLRVPMQWETADVLAARCSLAGEETVLSTVLLPDGTRRMLPPVCLPYSPEFRPPDPRKGGQTLARIAATTEGVECLNLAETWKRLPRRARYIPLGPSAFSAALLCFLLGVFHRRTGLLSRAARSRSAVSAPVPAESATSATRESAGRVRRKIRKKRAPDREERPAREQGRETGESAEPDPARPEAGSTLSAMRKASRRARRRTDR